MVSTKIFKVYFVVCFLYVSPAAALAFAYVKSKENMLIFC